MPIVEPVKVLTIDEVPLNVAEQSPAVQQLVTIFDEWNQSEADARNNLMMVSAAKDTLSRQIIQQVRTDQAEKAKAVEAAAAAAAPAPVPAAPVVDQVAPPVAEVEIEDGVEVANDTAE